MRIGRGPMTMSRKIIWIAFGVVILSFVWISVSKEKPTDSETTSAQDLTAPQLYERAQAFRKNWDKLKAKEIYQSILTEYPDYENIEQVQKELEDLNMQIIFSNTPTPKTVIYEVQSGDTLGELAKKFGTTINLIKKSNHLKSDIIRIGQRLRVWTGSFNILVDKSQNKLLLKEGDEVLKVYDVSTGKESSTPIGEFKILTKLVDPVWFNRGIVLPPESPQNVLGSRWLGFNMPGYGLHGTIDPESIGRQITAGCVRMRNKDVEELYEILPLGTEVVIIN